MIDVSAPAKLTLSLRITGVRDDGYHEIDAEMATLDFFDRLEISPSPNNGIEVRMLDASGNDFAAALPATDNLVARALALVGRGARVTVHKRIPAGAGLGGGSADAAAVLRWAGFTDTARAAVDLRRRGLLPEGRPGPGARHRADRRAASLRPRAVHPVAGAAVMQHRSRLRGVGRGWEAPRGPMATISRRPRCASLRNWQPGATRWATPPGRPPGWREAAAPGSWLAPIPGLTAWWLPRPSRPDRRGEGVGGAPAKDRARYWRRQRRVRGSSYLRRW